MERIVAPSGWTAANPIITIARRDYKCRGGGDYLASLVPSNTDVGVEASMNSDARFLGAAEGFEAFLKDSSWATFYDKTTYRLNANFLEHSYEGIVSRTGPATQTDRIGDDQRKLRRRSGRHP